MIMEKCIAQIYNKPISYCDGLKLQENAVERCNEDGLPRLIILEHSHVVTKGKNFDPSHAKYNDKELLDRGIEVHDTDRMGSITYHGPGQLVAYPILDLNNQRGTNKSIKEYIKLLEDTAIAFLSMYRITGKRSNDGGHAGIWCGINGNRKKIASIGIGIKRQNGRRITKHGIALNIETDLSYFNLIHPCGNGSETMISMQQVLDRRIPMKGAMLNFIDRFSTTAGIRFTLEEIAAKEDAITA